MDADALKVEYGDEYPAAIIVDGIRLPLGREGRFARRYRSDDHRMGHDISRFMDGSASMDVAELQREWPALTETDRLDFCQGCSWLRDQPDLPDMIRFVLQQAGPKEWSAIALPVASHLPRDEAFDRLYRALHLVGIGRAANITQAMALTKHPEAEPALRHHLAAILAHDGLWDDAEFVNWVAFDATTCIDHLIGLGAAPVDFEEPVRRLASHACDRNRDSCLGFLGQHYAWLT